VASQEPAAGVAKRLIGRAALSAGLALGVHELLDHLPHAIDVDHDAGAPRDLEGLVGHTDLTPGGTALPNDGFFESLPQMGYGSGSTGSLLDEAYQLMGDIHREFPNAGR
jgi:hypothetical protein